MGIIERVHAWTAEKEMSYSLSYRLQLFILQGNVRRTSVTRLLSITIGVDFFWAIVFKSFIGPSTETNANYGIVQC